MAQAKRCRWALLGTAGIARKNWQAIRLAGNASLVAVASRDKPRAASFIAGCQREWPFDPEPSAVGSYAEAIDRDDVDAVYLPLPTGVRADWAVRAAERGKHVLVEKPCGKDMADAQRIVAACRAAGVQFMDGAMFMHARRLEAMRNSLRGEVGSVARIASQFSFRAPPEFFTDNIRLHSDLEPLGCLGDLGVYPIMFMVWALEPRMPTSVVGRTLASAQAASSPRPVPIAFAGELFFADEPAASGSFYCSFVAEHQQWVHVSGSLGSLRVDDFVLPFFGSEQSFVVSRPVFAIEGCDFRMEQHDRRIVTNEYGSGHPTAPESNLFRNFSALVLSGKPDDQWPRRSLATHKVMMACLASAAEGGKEIAIDA